MAIPDTPYTREEMYLNAMATGDSGGIPPVPYTRQEMYLNEIARTRGGGSTGGGVLVVHTDADTGALDKTWQEIRDATTNGQIPVIYEVGDDYSTLYYVVSANNLSLYGEGYMVEAMTIAGGAFSNNEWVADSASGYPMPNE